MKPAIRMPASRGFTLIEAVATLLLLSLVATTLLTLNGNLFKGQTRIRQLETSTPWLQACAERVLAMRRTAGFEANPAFDAACDALTGSDSFNVTVTSNSGSASCPSSAQCQLVSIVYKAHGDLIGPVHLQLMNY